MTSTWPRGSHHARSSSTPTHPSFEHDTTRRSASRVVDDLVERVRHRAARVEHRPRRRITEIVSFAGDAVVRGSVPRDQRLPHVVVGGVAVLVVRRVEVGEIEVAELLDHCTGVTLDRVTGAREQRRDPQPERLLGARRPLLDVGHLHARGRVHPVGCLDEAREQDRLERVTAPFVVDRGADGVDACRVVRLDVPRLLREHVGDVAGRRRQRIELANDGREFVVIDRAGVGGDVAPGEHGRVAGAVHRGDLGAAWT